MKNRFIANGILSLISLIGFILFIAGLVNALHSTRTILYTDPYFDGDFSPSFDREERVSWSNLIYPMIGVWIFAICAIASFVMGIITLSMNSSVKNHGLGIASGVLGVLGGMFGVNAIVSFIGAYKEKKA